jgi:hypothetical protein
MLETNVLMDILIRERQAELRHLAARSAWFRDAAPARDRRHSLRERLGLALIRAGRALLRHGPSYTARRRLA